MPDIEYDGPPEIPPATNMVVNVGIGVAVILCLWTTAIAFLGGRMPIIGWETEGGFVTGVVWALFVVPIVGTVVYWLTMAIAVPLGLAEQRRRR